ncbi:TPA: hypothetical protein ACGUEK_004321, partial [Salmonella enterica]
QRPGNGMPVNDNYRLCFLLIYQFSPNSRGSPDILSVSSFSCSRGITMKSIINWDTGNWPVFLSGLGYPRWRGERCAIKTVSTVYPIILGNVLKITDNYKKYIV